MPSQWVSLNHKSISPKRTLASWLAGRGARFSGVCVSVSKSRGGLVSPGSAREQQEHKDLLSCAQISAPTTSQTRKGREGVHYLFPVQAWWTR